MGYNNSRLKFLWILLGDFVVNGFSNDEVVNVGSMRISRIVSVILNGVVLNRLAVQNGNNVDAMADTLMLNLSQPVQKNILSNEIMLVNHSLRKEIGRRINFPQAV
jgi:hypothetical protein